MDTLTTKISGIVEPSLAAMGYSLVRVKLMESGAGRTLQIMAEPSGGGIMSVGDCEKVSHTVSALLDVEDPIDGAYQLEISSPGIDRPLLKREDYAKHVGCQAKVELLRPIDGRRRFAGTILGAGDAQVEMDCLGQRCALPYADIQSAKLVLTDELAKEYLKKHKKAG